MFNNSYKIIMYCCIALLFYGTITVSGLAKAHSPSNQEICTKADLKNIKKFNKKINRYKRQNKKLAMDPADYSNKNVSKRELKEIQKTSKKINSNIKFWGSNEYLGMRAVYKRCDVEMYTPTTANRPFWKPN